MRSIDSQPSVDNVVMLLEFYIYLKPNLIDQRLCFLGRGH